MNIENEIFKQTSVNYKKLEEFGFIKDNDIYIFEKKFLNNDFKAIITVNKKGIVKGQVIDLQIGKEYLGLRIESSKGFSSMVRKSYIEILYDIKDYCFDVKYFMSDQSNRLAKYIKNKYKTVPEFLWEKYRGYGVFRCKENKKWYGIIMNVDLSKISNKKGEVEIINLKLEREKIQKLLKHKGFYEAYHMNKRDWISIVLDDTLKDEEIISLIDDSYKLVNY